MEKMLAKFGNNGDAENVLFFLLKLLACVIAGHFLAKEVMDNDYSATADLGIARFSLTKNKNS